MTYGLGIDLGTTFTAAAAGTPDGTEMLSLADRAMVMPSVVYLDPDGALVTGEVAERLAL